MLDELLAVRNREVDGRLEAITATMDRRLGELDTKVDRRLEHAAKQTNAIHKQLGEVGQATVQMAEQAKGLSELQEILRPPKARGGFGELLLENLLRDRLPATAFEFQYGFAGGERVDAVIKVDRIVPIDSKFPLDNFERMLRADNDIERQQFEKLFARDVKSHVDAISAKYIRPDEGTYDFAFMYLPSEAIYYELACGRTGALLAYAHEKRVLPVSPTTLTAYLQVIVLGLKGLQIEQHAHEVMAYCAQLQKDFGRFKEDFELVGTHLGSAQNKFLDSEKRLGKFESKLEQAVDSRARARAGRDARASARGRRRLVEAQAARRRPRRARGPGAAGSPSTVPPWASVWCTARSRPSSRRSICVPSSGQAPPSIPTRPQAGHSQASWSAPSWKRSRSTRPSEAASSVGPQPEEARALRPASSFQRSTASVSCSPRHDSSSGSTSSSSSAGVAWASALVQPMIALRASFESTSSNSERVSSEATTISCGPRSRRICSSTCSATSFRWSWTSFSMCRW